MSDFVTVTRLTHYGKVACVCPWPQLTPPLFVPQRPNTNQQCQQWLQANGYQEAGMISGKWKVFKKL